MNLQKHAQQSASYLQTRAIHSQWETDYLNSDMDLFYDQVFADIISSVPIKASDHILDAGCGYCFHTKRLAKSGVQITAIDFSEAALREATNTLESFNLLEQVALRRADITALPFLDATFDHIVCWGVLMHVPDLERALDELSRVLKVGGTLILSEINMRAPDVAIRERLVRSLKKLLRRELTQVRSTPRGIEVWTGSDKGGLMVRKTNMVWLEKALAVRNLAQTRRIAGQLTESYTNVPFRAWKRAIYQVNLLYYRIKGPPKFAASNVLFFRKC